MFLGRGVNNLGLRLSEFLFRRAFFIFPPPILALAPPIPPVFSLWSPMLKDLKKTCGR